jgi:prepilin peptidase CpaA
MTHFLSTISLPAVTRLLFGALLALAAICDVRAYRIPNEIPLGIALLFATAATAGLVEPLTPHLESFAIAATVGIVLFCLGVWGGGDAKLLAAVALFLEPRGLLAYALLVALAGGALALVVLLGHAINGLLCGAKPGERAHLKLPYGVALAAGGLAWCFENAS